jgi:hypothetical protein
LYVFDGFAWLQILQTKHNVLAILDSTRPWN